MAAHRITQRDRDDLKTMTHGAAPPRPTAKKGDRAKRTGLEKVSTDCLDSDSRGSGNNCRRLRNKFLAPRMRGRGLHDNREAKYKRDEVDEKDGRSKDKNSNPLMYVGA